LKIENEYYLFSFQFLLPNLENLNNNMNIEDWLSTFSIFNFQFSIRKL